ncbi:hypothetical protein XcvCFBP7112P_14655 [Xanthomonas citri pv. vignicola]|nr:hypothetical protein XcvCFBP7112P_14655 [Xanthomonas citri pv. vignicola]
MDAATELTRTYLQRVLRWWAGKGPAETRSVVECAVPSPLAGDAVTPSMPPTVPQSMRTPH